jgi:4-hydroxybenzoate polyprenyltransferase
MTLLQEKDRWAQTAAQAPGPVGQLRALIVSFRPHQWTKNLLLFGGLIFSRSLFDLTAAAISLEAFAAFCLTSSAVYLLNDLRDRAHDRLHPVKRFRPLASGALHPAVAIAALLVLLGSALLIGLAIRPQFAAVLGAYMVLNTGYSLGLKRVVILDVLLLAMGFVLRAVGGAVAIHVTASPWLFLCTLVLAVYVGLGKRRHELTLLQSEAHAHRPSLEGYSEQLLDLMMAITGGAAILAYALYTMADATVERFGGSQLILTVPFVLYGVFRYLVLVLKRQKDGDPATLLLTDPPSLVNVALWAGLTCFLIYTPVTWHLK